MPRARGGTSWSTRRPAMKISPALGCSKPAIMRSSVVLPQPEGPSRTSNSPSRMDRSTPSTASWSPPLKRLCSCRISTPAAVSPMLSRSRSDRTMTSTGCSSTGAKNARLDERGKSADVTRTKRRHLHVPAIIAHHRNQLVRRAEEVLPGLRDFDLRKRQFLVALDEHEVNIGEISGDDVFQRRFALQVPH